MPLHISDLHPTEEFAKHKEKRNVSEIIETLITHNPTITAHFDRLCNDRDAIADKFIAGHRTMREEWLGSFVF